MSGSQLEGPRVISDVDAIVAYQTDASIRTVVDTIIDQLAYTRISYHVKIAITKVLLRYNNFLRDENKLLTERLIKVLQYAPQPLIFEKPE